MPNSRFTQAQIARIIQAASATGVRSWVLGGRRAGATGVRFA